MTTPASPSAVPIPSASNRAMIALVFVAALVAFFPALSAGFIWDDQPGHVTRPELQSAAGLARIWFEPGATQQYYPLLHSAFWLEHKLWGESPFGYHLLNILLHATAASLVGVLLRRLAVPGAAFAALLFAIHPVMVESVAWISEQKNTLSAVFYLCATLAYLRFDRSRRASDYASATLLFLAALLTKTVTATLPAALLVIFAWQRRALSARRDVAPLVPWFALSIGAALMTAHVEASQIGASGADFALSGFERVLLAGRALWFYLGKLLWPADLMFVYPRWTFDVSAATQRAFPLAAAIVLIVLVLQRRRFPGLLAAALLFGGTLFPALGFVNVFPFVYSYVADHFVYLASIPVFAVVAAAIATRVPTLPRFATSCAAVVLVFTLGILTWRQTRMYHDVFTLYETTLARNPASWMAHNNLGIALVDAGRPAEALPHYERAVALRPESAEIENNFGYALNQLGRWAEALPHLDRALQLQPKYAEAANNRGAALMGLGRTDEGRAAFERATQLNPRYALARSNLGLALASSGRAAEALPQFEQAARLDPTAAEPELNWAVALTLLNRAAEAVPHFERTLRLAPNSARAHHTFGRALETLGRYDEAAAHYRNALDLDPALRDAQQRLEALTPTKR